MGIKCEKNSIREAPCETGKSVTFFREKCDDMEHFIPMNRYAKRCKNRGFQNFSKIKNFKNHFFNNGGKQQKR